MNAYEHVQEKLLTAGRAVKDNGHGKFQAQCPAHDDGNPSLSVTRIEGSVLLHCHAGCDTTAVLDVLGLTPADLFDTPRGAEYVYPGGRRVRRTPDKSFPQSGNKKDRSLFRGDRIASAEHVLVVEGEKDCLAAEAVGAVAVCSAMGAGKAHFADWTPLHGKAVTVVADNDESGRNHAAQVIEKLRAAGAASIRLTHAAVGKDLADHIAAGKTPEELIVDPIPAPPPKVSLTRLADVEPESVTWLWNGYLPRGKLVTLDGDPGLGKSTLALNLAGPVTTGGTWPDGTRCEHPGAVLLLSAEDGLADTVRPRLDTCPPEPTPIRIRTFAGCCRGCRRWPTAPAAPCY
jgi:putative DNA primase/helicase